MSLSQGAPAVEAIIDMVGALVLTAFAVYAGIALVRVWPNAVRIAKWYFFASAGLSLLLGAGVLAVPELWTLAEVFTILRSLATSGAWLAYLFRSERVRNTYSNVRAEGVSDVFR